MYEKLEQCPSCHSSQFDSYLIAQDHTTTQESFAILKCSNCELLVTNPRPTIADISRYYKSDSYISHTNKVTNLTTLLYKIARWITLRQKDRLLKDLNTNRKILDYGCGAGVLLEYLSKNNWDVTGIEPDSATLQQVIQRTNLPVFKELNELKSQRFGLITLWHVLEHIHDIPTTLRQLHSILEKRGTLLIAVPNHDSFDRVHYKENWAAYDVPRHLYHFTQSTLIELMKQYGFKHKSTIPMILDAYYVSLLSEKIKTGKSNYFKAMRLGYQSNKFAKNNHSNYSSLIYIFSKS